jgi:predicted Zn finger-like uncharacterized protein
MPLVIRCEHCQAQLRLPDEFVGKEVRCPSCQKVFMAREDLESRPKPPAPRPEPLAEEPGIRAQPGSERPPPPRREEDDEDYPRPSRRRYADDPYGVERKAPHNGGTIQTLGILSIVLVLCCWPLSLVFGIIALVMASSELSRIRSGMTDPSGESQINTGRTCAIIGIVLAVIILVVSCGVNMANH